MKALDALIRLCPPPVTGRGPASDGKGIAPIPPSHAAMLDVYGPGRFNDFLWIYGNSNSEIWPDIEARTKASSAILAGKKIPGIRAALTKFGISPDELIEWGATDNADCLFWVPTGQADAWPTLIVEAGQLDYTVVEASSPDVVLRFLEGRLDCPFFPAESTSRFPEFESWWDEDLESWWDD
ncbi:hypothetical protein [Streptomyces sp. NPDC048603]|uniref:hypothetical protein n=1 Tax=Streptomyces sp. NPDC048603 TaxID=3365577 RepID=UPI00371A3398